jgi:hypothetical protein
MVSDGGAGWDDGWQNLWLKIKMSGGRANRGGEDKQRAEQNARRVPDGVLDGSHVIGHIIFECHVTRLGWQGVILLPTLFSER